MSGRLTTHVLDTMNGRPAEAMTIELWALRRGGSELVTRVCTNADGRVDRPLLAEQEMHAGEFELVFCVGDYFAALGAVLPTPRFLDRVTVRFGLADPSANYHVPLLVSPWAYSTYRGS